jgi:hypothetical protein
MSIAPASSRRLGSGNRRALIARNPWGYVNHTALSGNGATLLAIPTSQSEIARGLVSRKGNLARRLDPKPMVPGTSPENPEIHRSIPSTAGLEVRDAKLPQQESELVRQFCIVLRFG